MAPKEKFKKFQQHRDKRYNVQGWAMAWLLTVVRDSASVRVVHLFKEQGTIPALSFGSHTKQSKEPTCLHTVVKAARAEFKGKVRSDIRSSLQICIKLHHRQLASSSSSTLGRLCNISAVALALGSGHDIAAPKVPTKIHRFHVFFSNTQKS